MKTHVHIITCTISFIDAFLIVATQNKQNILQFEWLSKRWYIHMNTFMFITEYKNITQ